MHSLKEGEIRKSRRNVEGRKKKKKKEKSRKPFLTLRDVLPLVKIYICNFLRTRQMNILSVSRSVFSKNTLTSFENLLRVRSCLRNDVISDEKIPLFPFKTLPPFTFLRNSVLKSIVHPEIEVTRDGIDLHDLDRRSRRFLHSLPLCPIVADISESLYWDFDFHQATISPNGTFLRFPALQFAMICCVMISEFFSYMENLPSPICMMRINCYLNFYLV